MAGPHSHAAVRLGAGRLLLALAIFLAPIAAYAQPPPEHLAVLRRGISITNWFRYPASAAPAALRSYLSDAAIAGLHRVGFTFVRLPVQPDFLLASPERLKLLIAVVRRLQRFGLGVVIDAHPDGWHLETSRHDRATLFAFWRTVAPALRPLDPRRTFPELLNEPVFPGAAAPWQALQRRLLNVVRVALPRDTIVLTGNDWGSIGGLTALRPVADSNVVYSFHFYTPPELTALAAYRAGLQRGILARLPFPVAPSACDVLAAQADAATAGGEMKRQQPAPFAGGDRRRDRNMLLASIPPPRGYGSSTSTE